MTEATNATRPTRNAQIAGILRFALRKMYGGATTVVTRGDDGEWRTLYTYEDVASLLGEFEQAAEHESVSAPPPPTGISHAWQPIETAPKDGTDVIVGGAEGVEVAQWENEHLEQRESGVIVDAGYDAGFWGFLYHGGGPQPTHWMPLPPSPSSQE